MSEIAKCRCGHGADACESDGDWYVFCRFGCGVTGPMAPTEPEAIAAWYSLMCPRPVAEWRAFVLGGDRGKFTCGKLWLGEVNGDESHWVARCHLTDEIRECANPWAARAWLEERVRAAGFAIRE